MIVGAAIDLAAAGLKLADTIEQNMNRPDVIAAAVKNLRQARQNAVDSAQAVIADPKASKADKDHAFQFIQRIES